MNDTTFSFLEFSFAVLLTISTLAYTFWEMTEWPDHYDVIASNATVFLEQTEIPHDVLWTGAQVVTKLYQLDDDSLHNVTIEVDGKKFVTIEDVKLHQTWISLSSNYSQEIVLDGNGQVTQIRFRKGV